MLSHRAWVYTYVMQMLEFGFGWEETFLYPTPLTHAGGCLMLPVLLRKGRCVIVDHFEPELFLETVEREKVTMTFPRADDDLRTAGSSVSWTIRPQQPAEYHLRGVGNCARNGSSRQ